MAPKELKKLKKAFAKRSLKNKLIEDCGYSRRHVNYVLNGEKDNDEIINKALEILAAYNNKTVML